MTISVYSLFKTGIGPSSSHTVGPMIAASRFIEDLKNAGIFESTTSVSVDLYGSLALTGKGHGTDKAVILGLKGELPHSTDPALIDDVVRKVTEDRTLMLAGAKQISFCPETNINYFRKKTLPYHSNGMTFAALTDTGEILKKVTFYSVGGGHIVEEGAKQEKEDHQEKTLPYPFSSGQELLSLCNRHKLSVPELVMHNETTKRDKEEVEVFLDSIWEEMNQCIERGCQKDGFLPGKLRVRRRARSVYQNLTQRPEQSLHDPLTVIDWVNLYALAVNEENASGSRIVTAPTNGAAGIIPAVLRYYDRFTHSSDIHGIRRFLLTATAIGSLYAQNASISGAEVGCQGEVGVACSMAAAGLTAALQGSPEQTEQAAEIAMEHNLGLTCDPIGGLVQIPCIERNAMGAVKAINAARIALRGNGQHFVSLDSVIKTMKETGEDMKSKYKETSRGGLAVNVPLC